MDPNKIGLQVQAIIGIATKLGYQEQVAMKLNQCREVRFVGVFSGRHDLILQAYFKNNEALVDFVNGELAQLEGIDTVDVSIELKQYKDSFSYIVNGEGHLEENSNGVRKLYNVSCPLLT